MTKQPIISDSTKKLDRQNNIRNEAAIHLYPSSTIQDLCSIVNNYAPSTKPERLLVHTRHNSCVRKVKQYRIENCDLPKVKNCAFERETTNPENDKFNCVSVTRM